MFEAAPGDRAPEGRDDVEADPETAPVGKEERDGADVLTAGEGVSGVSAVTGGFTGAAGVVTGVGDTEGIEIGEGRTDGVLICAGGTEGVLTGTGRAGRTERTVGNGIAGAGFEARVGAATRAPSTIAEVSLRAICPIVFFVPCDTGYVQDRLSIMSWRAYPLGLQMMHLSEPGESW